MGVKDLLRAVEDSATCSVWLGRIDGRPAFSHNADHLHYAASTMKLPVAIALMRAVDAGQLTLGQAVTVHNDFVSATGIDRFGVRRDEEDAPETWNHLGGQVQLGWLAAEMITRSGNLATNLVLELVGIDAAQRALSDAADGGSVIRRGIDDLPARHAGVENLTSAADLAAMLAAVGGDTIASPPSCARLRSWLAANEWNGQIPAGLPAGVRVEHKNGWVPGIRHDAGIVRPGDADPFVLAVCTTSELPDDTAQPLIADIAAVAWEHRHDLGSVI